MYQTEIFLATEHAYRRDRLARSWGGSLLPWRRRRRSVQPVPATEPVVTGVRAAAVPTSAPVAPAAAPREEVVVSVATTDGSGSGPQPAIPTYRDRVVVGIR